MTSTKPTEVQVQQTVVHPMLLWSKRKLWTVRIIILVVIGFWAGLWLSLHQQLTQSRARLERAKIEQTRRLERIRREAMYQQRLQERGQTFQPIGRVNRK